MDFTKLLDRKSNLDNNTTDNNLNFNNTSDNVNNKSEIETNRNDNNLDEVIMRGKNYINLLTDNHHYFINYNDCINNGNNILEINNSNNSQEIKNNIKLTFAKYKQGKNFYYNTDLNIITVIDNKSNKELNKVELPFAINLDTLLINEETKLNNLYIQVKNSYDLLIAEPQNDEEHISTFTKLRNKLELRINSYYTLQYVLNNLLKKRNNNHHYILHNVVEAYNSSSDDRKYLLQLKNSDINNKSLEYLLYTETELLNIYNDILQKLRDTNLDEKLDTEIKNDIQNYLKIKNDLQKNIEKLKNIKSKVRRATIYLTHSEIKSIDNYILTYYVRNLIKGNNKFNNSNNSINSNNHNNYTNSNNTSSKH